MGEGVGDYYVWWRLLDQDNAIDEPPTYLGKVTIHIHDHTSKTWLQDEEKDQHYKICDIEGCSEEIERGSHIWKQVSQDEATGARTYVCDVCGLERILEGDRRVISGKVQEHDGKKNAAGASVTLVKGSEVKAKTTTDSEGNYTFSGIEPGIYDIVVEYKADESADAPIITTTLVTVTAGADVAMETVKMNSENVNSELSVSEGSDTPAVVVGGLDAEAQEQEEADATVTVVMNVEGLIDGAADMKPETQQSIDAIKDEAGNEHIEVLEYLDLSVDKKIEQATGETTEKQIHETKTLLTVVVPIPEEWPAPQEANYVVYRFHDGKVDILTESPNAAGEKVTANVDSISIQAKNFSVYAIGCVLSEVKLPQNVSNGSITADKQYSAPGETVTLTVKPDSGYQVESLTVTDANGNTVKCKDNGDGTYTFVQPKGDVTVAVSFEAAGPSEPERYPVSVPSVSGSHGTVSPNRRSAALGERVILTMKPDAGYMLETITVKDQYGNSVSLTYHGDNTYSFLQPYGGVTVSTTFVLAPELPTYSITLPEKIEGGSITVVPKSAKAGSSVTITVKAEEGYDLSALTVSAKDGKAIELKANEDGTYTFTMPASDVAVKAEFVECPSLAFPDLNIARWYHKHTDYVISYGLMQGTPDGLFVPDGTVTRAQMVMLLWNLKGKPVVDFLMAYPDVDPEAWYAEAVRWATNEQVVNGYGDGTFGPNDPITREQMAAMLYNFEKQYGEGGFTGAWMYRLPFEDLDQISDWAFEAVAWCNMNGVITGKENSLFDPKGQATRVEMAAILTQYLSRE